MNNIRISAIAAMSENRVIGKDNRLPWHIPEEFKHFVRTTKGKPLIMGRKSYESIGKPLPGRANIVISRTPPTGGSAPVDEDGPFWVATLEEAIDRAKKIAGGKNLDEIFIAGGAQIYAAALSVTGRLYLTTVHRTCDGDTFFPEFDANEWKEISSERHDGDPAFTIRVLDRR